MFRLALIVCAVLTTGAGPTDVAPSTGTGPAGDQEVYYKSLAAKAGRDAEAHVKLALWCEAHGMNAERLRHLGLAVLIDPSHAAARGLLGLLRDNRGHWRRPADVAEGVRGDAERSAALAEYNARREKVAATPEAHHELARWCAEHGLKAEAVAHETAATRINPDYAPAWEALGCRKYAGRWLSPAQHEAERAEALAQKKADEVWVARLDKWRRQLAYSTTRDQAEAGLESVDDPRAVPAVCRVFGSKRGHDLLQGVEMLARIKSPASVKALAHLATSDRTPEANDVATLALRGQDDREAIDALVGLLLGEIKFAARPVGPRGEPGLLIVQGEKFRVKRVYRPPIDEALARVRPGRDPLQNLQRDQAAVRGAITNARAALNRDIARVHAMNYRNEFQNMRTVGLLSRYAGGTQGPDANSWRTWWADQQGYAYEPPAPPTRTRTQYVNVPVPSFHHSCFAAGTPVATVDGPRPIESVKVGDLVLSQDTGSGALSYQPVVAVFHNKPNATLRVSLGDAGGPVVATPIHRFWRAGKGWALARDLQPGDTIRTVGGTVRVASVVTDEVQPVYNLEVAASHSFFVGAAAALVHDNSLADPSAAAFDAPPDLGQ
jgi:hypothetical protein